MSWDRAGLMMYGQDDCRQLDLHRHAGNFAGHIRNVAAVAAKHFGGDLAGKLVVTGGMGGMGGAQPLAATMNGGAFLGIDVDPERIKRRVKTGYLRRHGNQSGRSAAYSEERGAQA